MSKAKMVVFTVAIEGRTAELDRWYDEQHIPDLLSVQGIVGAKRYDLRALQKPEGAPAFDFLAIYDFDAEDLGTVMAEAGKRMGAGKMPSTTAMDKTRTLAYLATEKG